MATVPPQRTDLGLAAPAAGAVAPTAAVPLPPGMAVGAYVIDQMLHQGTHGFVYRASDRHGEFWALKEFFPRALALRMDDGSMRARHAGDAISLSVAREAFHDEALALSLLEQAGLVRVLDTLVAHHTMFRVMPLVPGENLERMVAARATAPTVRELRALIEGLLAALDALHAAGLLHGHVTPQQMLVTVPPMQPLVTLLGFGNVARELGALNDAPWSAPEVRHVVREARITSAADLYSVAACAWFAATGQPPPSAAERSQGLIWSIREGLEVLLDEPDDPPTLRMGLVQALEAALAMAPEARPQHVADMRRLLAGDPNVRLVSVQPAPLWVGEMPDRDEQRGAIEVISARAVSAPAAKPVGQAPWSEARVSAPRSDKAQARSAPPPRPATQERGRPNFLGLLLLGLGLAGVLLWWNWQRAAVSAPTATSTVTLTVTPTSAAAEADAAPSAPPVAAPAPIPSAATPPAAAPVAVPTRPTEAAAVVAASPKAVKPKPAAAKKRAAPVAPRSACAGRTQFALLYCLQDQCNQPGSGAHPQCVELRSAGDIR